MALGAISMVYNAIIKIYLLKQAEVLIDLFWWQTWQLLHKFKELYDKDDFILVELPNTVWTLKVEFKKKGKAKKRGFTGLE